MPLWGSRFSLPVLGASAVLALLGASPAYASLLGVYGMTDDVWAAPVAQGRYVLDGRAWYVTQSPGALTLPALTVAYGLPANLEIGLSGAYGISGPGSNVAASAPSPLSAYLKWLVPGSVGGTTFGLIAGGQVPLSSAMEHNLALEGVASIPLGSALGLDVGLGVGENLVDPAFLEHGNLALYYTFASGQVVMGEVGTVLVGSAPAYVEHVGFVQPLTRSLTGDISLAANESSLGFGGFVPQVGLTNTF